VSDIPSDLHYTAEHEWVRRSGEDTVRVGITDFAQSALGDVVFVQLPDVGSQVTAGESFGEVESTKSVSDLFAPVWTAVRSWSTPIRTGRAGWWMSRSQTPPSSSRRSPRCSTPRPTAEH
jgi:glycine cleavage system H protein